MIRSMTAFGNTRAESEFGSISIDLRSVNNRYLDLSLRLPEDMRFLESTLRERLNTSLQRGKVELRLSFIRPQTTQQTPLQTELLQKAADDLELARRFIPDVPAPTLHELQQASRQETAETDQEAWQALGLSACDAALKELLEARTREGRRLADTMLDTAKAIDEIVERVETHMPQILQEQQQKIAERLHEALHTISPDGFDLISGDELSARIAQEASLFSLRVDVAEELTRLRSHVKELEHILSATSEASPKGTRKGSAGKRLDFLFQEMNREANTLGSKAGSLQVTEAAIDLKLLIEQMREQAQNIE